MQNKCCINGCFLNNSNNSRAHYLLIKMSLHNFISLQAFTVYMETLTAVWNFTSVKLIEMKFTPKWISLLLNSGER